jgi:serine/threonine protein kinase
MGEVYLAEDERIEQQVAFKVVRSELTAPSTASDALRLFQREARAVAKLDHPNILPLFDFGEEMVNGLSMAYLVMPYRSAGSLLTWLKKRNGLLPLQEVARLIYQAATALQHAHDRQIIHRDVKPSNFLIRLNKERPDQPDLLLADFGLALFSDASASMSGSTHGTPTYMPPEQWEGRAVPATDQYALAAMAYELFAGHPPFEGRPEQVMYQHFHDLPQPLNMIQKHISASLSATVLRALSKRPEDRFASILAFAQAVQDAVQSSASASLNPLSSMGGGVRYAAMPPSDEKAHIPFSQSTAQDMGVDVRQTPVSGAEERPYSALKEGAEEDTLPSFPPVPKSGPYPTFEQATEERTLLASDPALGERTVLSSNPALGNRTVLSSNPSLGGRPFQAPPESGAALTTNSPNASRNMLLSVVGLIVLLLLIGVDIFSVARINPLMVDGFDATATGYARSISATYGATVTSQAQATMAITANPYVSSSGPLVLYDPLTDNAQNTWQEQDYDAGSCKFIDGAYHATVTAKDRITPCIGNTTYTDFVFEVQMTLLKGDFGGIIFRSNDQAETYYCFVLNESGSYEVDFLSPAGESTITSGTTKTLMHTGLNQDNLLAVVAQGRDFALFVNKQHLVTVPDGLYRAGFVGITVSYGTQTTEAAFHNARIWTL